MTSSPAPIRLSIATPCRANWNAMAGNEQVRFCGQCRKNVYNLSAMNLEEVRALAGRPGEPICARFYQRPDGTVMTEDCPVGLAEASRRAALKAMRSVKVAGALLLASFGGPAALSILGLSRSGRLSELPGGRLLDALFAPHSMGALANPAAENVDAQKKPHPPAAVLECATPHR